MLSNLLHCKLTCSLLTIYWSEEVILWYHPHSSESLKEVMKDICEGKEREEDSFDYQSNSNSTSAE